MKKLFAALLLTPFAALTGPALAQDDPAARLAGRTAAMPPLSNRAMPAAPTVHRLSIGPLSNGFVSTPGEEIVTIPSETELSTDGLVQRAQRGDAEANYRLGLRYLSGEGVTRDLVEAFARIRLAAEAGHPRAVSLFYTLGAKLTADEHGEAFDRSQKLRKATDAARGRAVKDVSKQ